MFTAKLFGLLLAKLGFLALSFVQRQINKEMKALISLIQLLLLFFFLFRVYWRVTGLMLLFKKFGTLNSAFLWYSVTPRPNRTFSSGMLHVKTTTYEFLETKLKTSHAKAILT